jgi:hypothetical protein
MKTYQLITVESDEGDVQALKATLPDKTIMWIPTDPANGDYAEYQRYTVWVEAGNKPEDFWSQNSDI